MCGVGVWCVVCGDGDDSGGGDSGDGMVTVVMMMVKTMVVM